MISYSPKMALGLDDSHLRWSDVDRCFLTAETLSAWHLLQQDAQAAGFSPKIVSGYRGFDRQLQIWNDKVEGRRQVLDDASQPIAIEHLDDEALMWAILRWSALPGTSRHHFGSDFDVVDTSRMPEHYRVQLTPEECQGDGVCAAFHLWLDEWLSAGACNFYRPYTHDLGGVAPEPWHLSFAPAADKLAPLVTFECLSAAIAASEIGLKASILANLPEIMGRYISR